MTFVSHPEHVAQTQLDNGIAKAKPVKMGWTTAQIEAAARSLNELLANYSVHFQKLRNYHWNVKGSAFFDLHEQFGQLYEESQNHIDLIAERIRIFGKQPVSLMREYLEIAEIEETPSDLSSDVMVRELLNDYTILLKYMAAAVSTAEAQGDFGTEAMVKIFVKRIEEHHWMFSAFLSK